MFFHLILTPECNLQCRYCFDEAFDDMDSDFLDFEVDYSLPKKDKLRCEFVKQTV